MQVYKENTPEFEQLKKCKEIFNEDSSYEKDEDVVDYLEINQNIIDENNKNIEDIEENKFECSICLEEYKIGDKAKKTSCQHLFHVACIRNW
uniref:RING-type domain-containing protein n=1 Tax=Meloidogyne javanica TaxID=6303 RepID=A0A915LMI0_MELJA